MGRVLLVFLWLVLAMLVGFSPSYGGGVLTENFINNIYNQDLWFISTQGIGPSTAVTNNRLEITLPANSSTGGNPFPFGGVLGCKFALRSDYDVQVDFTLFNWPVPTGVQVGIQPVIRNGGFSAGFWLMNDPTLSPGPTQVYNAWLNGSEFRVATSDTSGKLRLQRVGNTINAYYWSSGWQLLGSNTASVFEKDCGFNFYVFGAGPASQNFQGKKGQVAFDNLQITYTSFAPDIRFSPAAIDLLLQN
jgi:hypothetical protein